MFIILMASLKWKSCTSKSQGQIARRAYKTTIFLTKFAFLYGICSQEKWVLVTLMLKGFLNCKTLNVDDRVLIVSKLVDESMAMMFTKITFEHGIRERCLWGEGKRKWETQVCSVCG
jgi:hypothetical protein